MVIKGENYGIHLIEEIVDDILHFLLKYVKDSPLRFNWCILPEFKRSRGRLDKS